MFLGLLCFQDLETDIVAVWSAMEDLVKKGLVRSIGLSNFNMGQIKRIMSSCKIVPANQVNVESTCVCNTPALPQGIVLDAIPPASVSGSKMFLDFEDLVHPGTGILWSPKFNFLPTI